MGGAKNHGIVMPDADLDQVVNDLTGAAFGSAGERCMALPVVVPVGEKTADALREKLVPAIETLRVGVSTDADAHYGPVVNAAAQAEDRGLHPDGRRRGRRAGRRRPRLHAAGLREGLLHRPDPVRPREAEHADLPGGDLRPGAADRPRRELRGGGRACRPSISTATASPSSPATATPRASSPPGSMSAWSASTCRSRCRSPITPSAAGSARASATPTSTAWKACASGPRSRPSPSAGPTASPATDKDAFVIPTMG